MQVTRRRSWRVLSTLLSMVVGGCGAHGRSAAPKADHGEIIEPAAGDGIVAGTDASADPDTLPATAEQRATGEARLAPALARVLAGAGVRLDQLADVQVVAAALGGGGDQVVAAELHADARHLASALWIVGGPSDARRVLASQRWQASDAEDGFYDDPAGIRELAVARIVWSDRDVIRMSVVQRQGGHDPRYRTDTVYLLSLEGDRLETLFACARAEDNVSGPGRAGVSITREIGFAGTPPQEVRVDRQTAYDPGVLEEPEAETDQLDRGVTADSLSPATGRYRFSQGRYRPTGPAVCQPY